MNRHLERLANLLAVVACLVFFLTLPPGPLRPAVFLPRVEQGVETSREPAGLLQVRAAWLREGAPVSCVSGGELSQVPADCADSPIAHASVQIFWERAGAYLPVAAGITDEQGRAGFDALPQGQTWLLVEGSGSARRSLPLLLGPNATEQLVVLERAGDLSVTVVDEKNAAIPGATVLVSGVDPLPFAALSGSQGEAVFARLGRSPWQVSAAARGYEKVSHSNVTSNLRITLRRLGGLWVSVVDAQEKPVPNAQVFVGGALWPPRQGTTDSSGNLQLGGLEAGTYDLRAVHESQVSRTHIGIALQRGETRKVRLRLEPGRTITVLVSDGEEEDAIPIADADVVLTEYGIAPFPIQGRTGEDGLVTLGPIAAGPASVAAYAEGFIGRAAVPVPDPLQGVLRIALRRGATIHGEVVDRNGHAIDGARIEVIGTDLDGLPIAETPWFAAARRGHFQVALAPARPLIPAGELGIMPGPIPGVPSMPGIVGEAELLVAIEPLAIGAPWVSDVGGSFRLYPVSPGRVRLLVRHPSYLETVSEAITLAPGGEATVKIVMLEGASLKGRVLDDAGIPVAHARIEVAAVRGVSRSSTFSASDGTFEFEAVPGSIVLSLARPENPVEFVLRKNLELDNEGRLEIDLVLPAERAPITVGIVAERHAVDLAQVVFLSLDPEIPLKKTLFSDVQGRVEVADAAGIPLRLMIDAPGFARFQRTFEQAPRSIEIELQRGVLVTGAVTAVRGRQNVVGASVTLLVQGERHGTQTDANGHYEFRDLNPGTATLSIAHPEYARHEATLQIQATDRADRPFEIPVVDLLEGGSLRGVVLDEAGDPVRGARVALGVVPSFLPAGELPPGMTRSNERGEFELSNVAAGSVTLEAYLLGKGRGRAQAEVSPGQVTSDVRIELHSSGADTETAQVAGVAITLGEGQGGGLVILQVAHNSQAERAGLQVGDRVLAVEGVQVTSMAEARVRLSGSEGTDALIELRRADSIFKLRVTREQLRR